MRDLLRLGGKGDGEINYVILPFILGRLMSVFRLAAVHLHSSYLWTGIELSREFPAVDTRCSLQTGIVEGRCLAMASAARMAKCIMVKVGLALPEDGKTEALATLRFSMR